LDISVAAAADEANLNREAHIHFGGAEKNKAHELHTYAPARFYTGRDAGPHRLEAGHEAVP